LDITRRYLGALGVHPVGSRFHPSNHRETSDSTVRTPTSRIMPRYFSRYKLHMEVTFTVEELAAAADAAVPSAMAGDTRPP
jgi:hypothetical protein